MRAVIGVIPLFDETKDSYWMLPGYMKVIEQAGALPIMLPMTTDTAELDDAYKLCDGILFTGGHDVDPAVYNEAPKVTCGIACHERDVMEGYLLDKAIADDKPFLGICRGIQFINAHLGGTLYQDLPTEYECTTEHHMSAPYDRPAHKVTVLENTLLADIIGVGTHEVNSYHHQAVKDLADNLTQMAVSEDGLIEAISVDGIRFGVGVQWHPEFSYLVNENSNKLVQAFINACT